MSTARPQARSVERRPGEQGFTYLEMVVVLSMTALLAWLVERTMLTATNAEQQIEAVSKATERGQRLAYDVRDLVSASRKLFVRDGVGDDYLTACEISGPPVDGNGRLPVIQDGAQVVPDVDGDNITGNMLLFVREGDPAPVVVNPATREKRYIDTYRFVLIYPTVTSRVISKRKPLTSARDLVIWWSDSYASFTQLDEITNPLKKQAAAKQLVDIYGITHAWDSSEEVDDAFFAMDALGDIASTATADFVIEEDANLSDQGNLTYAGVQLAPTRMSDYHRQAKMVASDTDWWPQGFEVKIVGVSGSRRVWMRLTVETPAVGEGTGVHASELIASLKDL